VFDKFSRLLRRGILVFRTTIALLLMPGGSAKQILVSPLAEETVGASVGEMGTACSNPGCSSYVPPWKRFREEPTRDAPLLCQLTQKAAVHSDVVLYSPVDQQKKITSGGKQCISPRPRRKY
jgi:hypothetical protein